MKQIFSFKKKEKGTEKKPVKKLVLGAVLLAVIAGGAVFVYQKKAASLSKKETSVRTGTVTRQTIQQSLSSSGTISPKNSYTITSMVGARSSRRILTRAIRSRRDRCCIRSMPRP